MTGRAPLELIKLLILNDDVADNDCGEGYTLCISS